MKNIQSEHALVLVNATDVFQEQYCKVIAGMEKKTKCVVCSMKCLSKHALDLDLGQSDGPVS